MWFNDGVPCPLQKTFPITEDFTVRANTSYDLDDENKYSFRSDRHILNPFTIPAGSEVYLFKNRKREGEEGANDADFSVNVSLPKEQAFAIREDIALGKEQWVEEVQD